MTHELRLVVVVVGELEGVHVCLGRRGQVC